MGGELIVKISSENSGKTEIPEFDLLKCDNSACVNCVQFLEKEYKVKVIGDKIILKNLSEGYYLFIPRVPAESFIYFDKKAYKVFVPEKEKSTLNIREMIGGGVKVAIRDRKNNPFIPKTSQFINIWFEGNSGKPVFYGFDKIKEDTIEVRGIPVGDYKLVFLCEGYGVKNLKNIKIKKGESSHALINIDRYSKTGIEGVVKMGGNIPLNKIAVSYIELIKKGENKKYGVSFVDEEGKYKIIDVKPGQYRLFGEIKGFDSGGREVSLDFGQYDLKIKKGKMVKRIIFMGKN
jgi:hypothetical protein